jgi:hypothetical protein
MGKRIHREHSGRAIEEDGMQFHFGLVWRLSRSRRKITVDQEACSVIRWSSCASTMLGVFEVKK